MPKYIDQLHRSIELPARPRRIVSLVPSQTELLAYLGLEEETVGLTKFCVHPKAWFRSKERIGGTKSVKLDVVRALQPDLIIANKEENDREQVEALAAEFPVWISDIKTLEDSYDMIKSVGEMCGKATKAEALNKELRKKFARVHGFARKSVAYFIWQKPYMAAGRDTFINHILKIGGLDNVFKDYERYPEVSIDLLKERSPELILLSSEPFPFKEKHIAEMQEFCPNADIRLADGELFSWYGPRLLHTPDYLMKLVLDNFEF